jgi:hypothetical protein
MSKNVKSAKKFQEKWNLILQDHTPDNISLAREISELLDISIDSAYRRLRNDTEYTLDEAAIIANHFNLPLEALNTGLHSVVSFRINKLDYTIGSYRDYLQNIKDSILRLSHLESPAIYYGAEDIPVFYHFGSPALMEFKMTYWLKSLMLVPEFQYKNFGGMPIPEELKELSASIFELFSKIETTEIWTVETVMSTIKQIMFYWDAGFFDTAEQAFNVIDDLETNIKRIQRSAETGYKFSSSGTMLNVRFHLYISDVMIGTNSIMAKSDNFSASFISYSTFNFMQTNNLEFNRQNQLWMNNLISRSSLISATAEKQRNQFFKAIYRQVGELREHVLKT